MTTALHTGFASHSVEDPMTVCTRTRQAGATGYYLGRPAAFWRAVLAPRSAVARAPAATSQHQARCSGGSAASTRRGMSTG